MTSRTLARQRILPISIFAILSGSMAWHFQKKKSQDPRRFRVFVFNWNMREHSGYQCRRRTDDLAGTTAVALRYAIYGRSLYPILRKRGVERDPRCSLQIQQQNQKRLEDFQWCLRMVGSRSK